MEQRDYSLEELVCDESFQRYCTGAHSGDVLFWERWLAQHPGREADVEEARRLVMLLNAGQGNRLQQLQQLREGLRQSAMLQETLEATGKSTARRRAAWKYAAGIAALIAGIAAVYLYKKMPAPPSPATASVYRTGNEDRRTIVLADGTVITMRANSTITPAPGFNTGNREVSLNGEAFFDVKQQAAQPFVVHTSAMRITVLGTVFNVSAYEGRGQSEAALFRGKVAVDLKQAPGRSVVLQPNQKLVVGKATPAPGAAARTGYKVQPLAADPVSHKATEIAWVRNRLQIEDEPLSEIAKKLEQWYGIPLTFEDEEVKQYRYSGTFESETIVKALEALQLSYPFSFRVQNNRVIISK